MNTYLTWESQENRSGQIGGNTWMVSYQDYYCQST